MPGHHLTCPFFNSANSLPCHFWFGGAPHDDGSYETILNKIGRQPGGARKRSRGAADLPEPPVSALLIINLMGGESAPKMTNKLVTKDRWETAAATKGGVRIVRVVADMGAGPHRGDLKSLSDEREFAEQVSKIILEIEDFVGTVYEDDRTGDAVTDYHVFVHCREGKNRSAGALLDVAGKLFPPPPSNEVGLTGPGCGLDKLVAVLKAALMEKAEYVSRLFSQQHPDKWTARWFNPRYLMPHGKTFDESFRLLTDKTRGPWMFGPKTDGKRAKMLMYGMSTCRGGEFVGQAVMVIYTFNDGQFKPYAQGVSTFAAGDGGDGVARMSVFDGELLGEDRSNCEFVAFDIAVSCNLDLVESQEPWTGRQTHLMKFSSARAAPTTVYRRGVAPSAKTRGVSVRASATVSVKVWEDCIGAALSASRNKNTDGLIAVLGSSSYAEKGDIVLKLKEMKDLTVDFKAGPQMGQGTDEGVGEGRYRRAVICVNGTPVWGDASKRRVDVIDLTVAAYWSHERVKQGMVYECRQLTMIPGATADPEIRAEMEAVGKSDYDVAIWCVVKAREDKTRPNSSHVANTSVECYKRPMTLAQLGAACGRGAMPEEGHQSLPPPPPPPPPPPLLPPPASNRFVQIQDKIIIQLHRNIIRWTKKRALNVAAGFYPTGSENTASKRRVLDLGIGALADIQVYLSALPAGSHVVGVDLDKDQLTKALKKISEMRRKGLAVNIWPKPIDLTGPKTPFMEAMASLDETKEGKTHFWWADVVVCNMSLPHMMKTKDDLGMFLNKAKYRLSRVTGRLVMTYPLYGVNRTGKILSVTRKGEEGEGEDGSGFGAEVRVRLAGTVADQGLTECLVTEEGLKEVADRLDLEVDEAAMQSFAPQGAFDFLNLKQLLYQIGNKRREAPAIKSLRYVRDGAVTSARLVADSGFEEEMVAAIKEGGRELVAGVAVETFVRENMLSACSIRTIIFKRK